MPLLATSQVIPPGPVTDPGNHITLASTALTVYGYPAPYGRSIVPKGTYSTSTAQGLRPVRIDVSLVQFDENSNYNLVIGQSTRQGNMGTGTDGKPIWDCYAFMGLQANTEYTVRAELYAVPAAGPGETRMVAEAMTTYRTQP